MPGDAELAVAGAIRFDIEGQYEAHLDYTGYRQLIVLDVILSRPVAVSTAQFTALFAQPPGPVPFKASPTKRSWSKALLRLADGWPRRPSADDGVRAAQ